MARIDIQHNELTRHF